jgi:peptide/nickel transport system permease protein
MKSPAFSFWIPIGLALVLLGIAIFGKWLTPFNPLGINMDNKFLAPGGTHWMGTDYLGRDVFSRVLAGAGLALRSAAVILVSASIFGVLVGLISGYYGGIVDEIFMRLSDILIAFPGLVLALAIAAALGPNLTNAMFAIAVVWWPPYARLVRGQVLSIREQDFVTAAHCVGTSNLSIIFRHIFPNVIIPFIIQVTADVGPALVTTSSLSFIGMGAQPPTPEWGSMVSDGRKYLLDFWWMAMFPGAAIFITVLIFNGLGESLRKKLELRR